MITVVALSLTTALIAAGMGLKAFTIWVNRTAGGEIGEHLRRIDELEERVAELEERSDFAERLLTEGPRRPADTPA